MPIHELRAPKTACIRFGLLEYAVRWILDILVVDAACFHQSSNENHPSATMQ